jgi:hypothetical protein
VSLGDHQREIDDLLRRHFPEPKSEPHNGQRNGRLNGKPKSLIRHHNGHVGGVLADEAVIERCRKADNAVKFASLFDDGNTSAYGADDSAADAALLSILVFYTQDREQLERLFERSALVRAKWTSRRDYRERTIDYVLQNLSETYGGSTTIDSPIGNGNVGEDEEENRTGSGSGSPISNGTGTGRRRLTSTAFLDMPTPEPRRYLVDGIVPESYPTMIYGDGGVAKSMLALSLGLGVASDAGTWLGHKIEPGGVLYLDFELDAVEQNRRVSRLVNAEGLGKPPRLLRYMSAVGVRARDAFEDALAECKEHDVKLLIIDSLGPALEGDAEASRDVISFFNEVVGPFRTAGVAPFVIDHQSKMQAGERYQNKRAFGSVFKSNLARSVLQVEATDRSDGELTVRLRQNKHNFGPLLKPFGARLTFSEEEVRIEAAELEDSDLAEEGTLNARDRIRLALKALGEGTRSEINELVSDLASGTMKKELAKLKELGETEETGEVRDRQQVVRLIGSGSENIRGTGTGTGGETLKNTMSGEGTHPLECECIDCTGSAPNSARSKPETVSEDFG